MNTTSGKKVLAFIVVCLMLISVTACGSSKEESKDSSTDSKDDFESYTQYIGQPLSVLGDDFEEVGSSNNGATYKTPIESTWNNNKGTITVMTNSDGDIIRFVLEFSDTYLNGDDFTNAKEYLKEKYGEGKELTADIADYYFDDYNFRLMRSKCVLGWDEEHLSNGNVQNDSTTRDESISPEAFTTLSSWIGKTYDEVVDDFGDLFEVIRFSDDINFATYNYGNGEISLMITTDDNVVVSASWYPYASQNSISTEDADYIIDMLNDKYGKPVKTIELDNTAPQYKTKSDTFNCKQYLYKPDQLDVIGEITKDDGSTISEVEVRFSK